MFQPIGAWSLLLLIMCCNFCCRSYKNADLIGETRWLIPADCFNKQSLTVTFLLLKYITSKCVDIDCYVHLFIYIQRKHKVICNKLFFYIYIQVALQFLSSMDAFFWFFIASSIISWKGSSGSSNSELDSTSA